MNIIDMKYEDLAAKHDEIMRDVLGNSAIEAKWTAIALLYGQPNGRPVRRGFASEEDLQRFVAAFRTVFPKYSGQLSMMTLLDLYETYRCWYWRSNGTSK